MSPTREGPQPQRLVWTEISILPGEGSQIERFSVEMRRNGAVEAEWNSLAVREKFWGGQGEGVELRGGAPERGKATL